MPQATRSSLRTCFLASRQLFGSPERCRRKGSKKTNGPPGIAKTEALLDRAHFSPGEIDGVDGDNFRSALHAFQEVNGLAVTAPKD